MTRTIATRFGLILLASFAFAVVPATAQTTWRVDDDAAGDPAPGDPSESDPLEDGTEAHPFDAIQEGIDAAADGDTVLVAEGSYSGLGNRDLDFNGKLITVRSESQCLIECEGEGIGLYFHNGETADARLEGFRIYAANVSDDLEGAIVCDGASPTIINCRVVSSTGVGLYCRGSTVRVEDCKFEHNHNSGVECHNSHPTLINCDIKRNSSDGVTCHVSNAILISCEIEKNDGFGVACHGGSLTISDSQVEENDLFGVYCNQADLDITSSQIFENLEVGIYCWDGNCTIHSCSVYGNRESGIMSIFGETTKISNTDIYRNVGTDCGGVWFDTTALEMNNCTISRNITVDHSGFAAGISGGGADAIIHNCIIDRNLGGAFGGGVSLLGSRAVIANSLIARNDTIGEGGGIHCEENTEVILLNTAIVENTATYHGSAVFCWRSGAKLVNCVTHDNLDTSDWPLYGHSHNPPSRMEISHSCIEGGEDSVYVDDDELLTWGPGNIDADPLFVDPGELDYRLSAGSPCIDAGCNCGVPQDRLDADGDGDFLEPAPFDLDGDARFFDDSQTPDTGDGWPPIVDIGPYEFGDEGPQPCFGDLDGDRDVDLGDLAQLLGFYGTIEGATGRDGDMDCDGDVDLRDLAALLGLHGDRLRLVKRSDAAGDDNATYATTCTKFQVPGSRRARGR